MQNFFTANHYELNKNQEAFYQNLYKELQENFCRYSFKIEPYSTSQEQSLSLNSLGLKFLKIQPLVFKNGNWIKDKNWIWNNEKKDLISNICSKVAMKQGFEFIGLNSDRDNYPLFIVKVASNDFDKDLLDKYDTRHL